MTAPCRVVLLVAAWSKACRQAEARLRRAGLVVEPVDADAPEGHALRAAHGVEAVPAAFVRVGGRLRRVVPPTARAVRAAVAGPRPGPPRRPGARAPGPPPASPRPPQPPSREPPMQLAPEPPPHDLLAFDPARAAKPLRAPARAGDAAGPVRGPPMETPVCPWVARVAGLRVTLEAA